MGTKVYDMMFGNVVTLLILAVLLYTGYIQKVTVGMLLNTAGGITLGTVLYWLINSVLKRIKKKKR